MKRLFVVLFAVVVLVGGAAPANAAPMHSPFSLVRQQATTVVVGKVHQNAQGDITIDVDKVIRGTVHTGPRAVKPSPDGHMFIANDERVVAFIDASNAFRWAGRLVAGTSLESGVMKLQGFFDFNAHLVTPGIMSFADLGTALQTGALTQTFDATLAFPDGHGGLRSVPNKRFTVQYDPFASRLLSIQGLTMPCLGQPSLGGLTWGSFEVRLSDTCLTNTSAPQRDRSLGLDGTFTGVSSTGAIEVRVVPSRPFLTEVEYEAFARDRDLVSVTRVVRVTLASGAAWSWQVESQLVDPTGKTHAAGGVSTSQLQNGTSEDMYDFTGAKITISPSPQLGSPGGNPRGIVSLVESGTITRCTFSQQGLADVACTLTHVQPILVRR